MAHAKWILSACCPLCAGLLAFPGSLSGIVQSPGVSVRNESFLTSDASRTEKALCRVDQSVRVGGFWSAEFDTTFLFEQSPSAERLGLGSGDQLETFCLARLDGDSESWLNFAVVPSEDWVGQSAGSESRAKLAAPSIFVWALPALGLALSEVTRLVPKPRG